MRISLDYDGTYTADPALWDAFIRMAKRAGHDVVCVTMRFPNLPVCKELSDAVAVYYTCHKAKQHFMAQADVDIDVWIDDCPSYILFSAQRPGL